MNDVSRRSYLKQTVACFAPLAGSENKTLKVVVAGGHPGDPEYGCGGTVARLTAMGHSVSLLYLNRGEKGCGPGAADCGPIRTEEAQRACRILRAHPRFASEIDGEAIVDGRHYDEFRTLITQEKPDLVFNQWPIDNHRDHRAISLLTYDAWVKSGRAFGLYYYEVSDGEDTTMFSPTDFVNVTDVEQQKRAACFAHASQAPERFYALQSRIMQFRGTESGFRFAEGFARHPESRKIFLP